MKTESLLNKKMVLPKNSLEELLIDRSIDAIIALDKEYKVTVWNKTASVIYKVSKHNAIGKSIFEIIPDLKEDQDIISAIQQASFGISSFVPASKKFPHRRHVENHYLPIEDDSKNLIGVMIIAHDVAHRIKAEQQLQQLNEELETRLRQLKITTDELASFTYVTSNKIKEPIRHIYTGIEYLIKTEAHRFSDSGKATFRRMQSSLNRMDLLLDDILSLSQISVLQKTDAEVNLDELVKEVQEKIKTKADKLIRFITTPLGSINGYKNYIQTLLYNLLDNAAKFNQNNEAVIKVSGSKVFFNTEAQGLLPEIEYYKLTVEDNGIGVAKEDQEKIFKLFEKLHDKEYKGSGVGLAVAQKIMNAHGGFVGVESTPGNGAVFACYFPVQKNS